MMGDTLRILLVGVTYLESELLSKNRGDCNVVEWWTIKMVFIDVMKCRNVYLQ